VGRLTYQPNETYSFTARGRFDEQTFAIERLELEARANFDRWNWQILYGDYAPQPELGFLFRRQGIMTGASFKVTENWLLLGSMRYDLYAHEFDESRIGVGYVDDCLMLSVNWLTGYTYTGTTTPVRDTTVFMQLSLRTLGPDTLSNISATP
jgi:LPS-assembly protein